MSTALRGKSDVAAVEPQPPVRTDRGPGWFAIFSTMWGIAVLAHQGKAGLIASTQPHDMLMTVMAVLVLFHPSSLRMLVAAILVQLAGVVIDLPFYITNHWYVMSFLNLGLLAVLATLVFGRRGRVDRDELILAFRPAVIVATLALYVIVTVCKVNVDFLDPVKSSAAEMTAFLATHFPPLGSIPHLMTIAIWGTLVVEGALPLLLAIPATRTFGLLFGWAFHLVLCLVRYYDFSAMMLLCYTAFLPLAFPDRLRAEVQARPRLRRLAESIGRLSRRRSVLALAIFLVLSPSLLRITGISSIWLYAGKLMQVLWIVSATIVAGLFVLTLIGRSRRLQAEPPEPADPSRFARARAIGFLTPVLLVLNGLCPYLGLKTDGAFTMFSNLQTEGPYWNHLFMPKAMRVFPFQDDLVQVIDCSLPEVREEADLGSQWIYFEFRDLMSRNPDASVSYAYRGVRHDVPCVADDPELSPPTNPVLRKLLFFRTVVPPERNFLRH